MKIPLIILYTISVLYSLSYYIIYLIEFTKQPSQIYITSSFFLFLSQIKVTYDLIFFDQIIGVFNILYFLSMIIYSIIEKNSNSNTFFNFIRDIFFQILFIFNEGLFFLFLFDGLLFEIYPFALKYKFIYHYISFLLFLFDAFLCKRTNGQVSFIQIIKISFIFLILLTLPSFFKYRLFQFIYKALYDIFVVFFSGTGMYCLVFDYKIYLELCNFHGQERRWFRLNRRNLSKEIIDNVHDESEEFIDDNAEGKKGNDDKNKEKDVNERLV